MDIVIEVNNLTKRYGNILAIDSISFNVFKGEVFSYLGPNGSGKTTTVEILSCIRKPTSGDAKILGYSILKDKEEIKKRIGILPQEFTTFDLLTVKENVELIAKIYKASVDIKNILELFGLYEYRNKKYKELSGGLKRRVGLAMSVVNDPDILFLDEPTTGIDPEGRRDVWNYIINLKKMGKTIFLTTHYMEEAERLSDRIGIILKGKIITLDYTKNIIEKYGGNYKILIKKDNFALDVIKNLNCKYEIKENLIICETKDKKETNLISYELLKNNIENFEVKEPNLEDAFLNLVGYRISEKGELL